MPADASRDNIPYGWAAPRGVAGRSRPGRQAEERMRLTRRWTTPLAAAGALLAAAASGDVIILKNGSRIVGQIERIEPGEPCAACAGSGSVTCQACQGTGVAGTGPCALCGGKGKTPCQKCKGRGSGESYYVIRAKGGVRTTIPESQVESVERSDVPPEDLLPTRESYAERLRKLAGSPEDELELARWALERGLCAEAARHARKVLERVRPEDRLAGDARATLEAAERRLEAAAAKALGEALATIKAGRLEEGARALEEAMARHSGTRLVSDAGRSREFLEERARDLVGAYGPSLGEIARGVRARAALACPACSGTGASACSKCEGTGFGPCPRCKGSGQLWCPDCNGTQWRVCATCGGTGKASGLAAQLGISSTCGECFGRGVVQCKRCRNGRIPCPACAGKGKIPGACPVCAGKGSRPCEACAGTGLRRPERIAWGPVAECKGETLISKEAPAFPIWQGLRRGCIVTVVRESDLLQGALAAHLAAALGERRELLLACVDNRDGRDQIEFAPDKGAFRVVTDDARQAEAEPPLWIEKALAARADLREALAQFAPAAILPGAVANVAAALPAGTELGRVESVYWGREEPWRLQRRYITVEELAQIRNTLR